ncbi:MAG: DUF885 domain-containing protein [Gammaproteobacteria bacterium]|nr:DUF885 domain-containing protein [Gammaproteobacteria bacterium]
MLYIRNMLLLGLSCGLLCLPGPLSAQEPGEIENEVTRLRALFDQAWEYELASNPQMASSMGDARYNHLWQDLSIKALTEGHLAEGQFLVQLSGIHRDRLPEEEQLNYDLFQQTYQQRLDAWQYQTWLMPVNQRGGVQTADQLADAMRFTTIKDYANWIARLRAVGVLVEQNIELMQQGVVDGWVQPRVIMQRVPAQIEIQIVSNPVDSGFYRPFLNFPDSISSEDQERLRQMARKSITEVVVPAYKKLQDFFVNQYLPACRDTVGAWALPDGRNFYEFRTRLYTSTDMTPDEVHQRGLEEVQRIRGQMQEIIDELEFEGSFKDFLEFLRTDPQFYYQDPEQLYQAYLATAKRIDPELVNLFGRLPRNPYGVRPIPEASAPDTTTAYYMPGAADGSRAGYYYVNLYRPETRPKYEIEVLTVHEAMPGHHLQISLAQELGEIPKFRRYQGATAFVEGWGLYSESLGSELGLYKDPYSRFGQLTYEMWRAVRLVVDTGIHYRGWSRQQAIDFFMENAAKSELDIVNEIDRYIAWPGQALAYKIGEIRIKELREAASTRLGDAFNIKEFHDVLLGAGALPLDLLSRRIDHWIVTRLAEENSRSPTP